MAHHQGTGIIAGGSTTGGATLGPLTTCIAGRQQCHSLLEILLHLIKHLVIGTVRSIETIEGRIGVIIGNQNGILIIASEVIICQTTQEQHLSLDALHLIGKGSIILTAAGNAEVGHVDGIVPVAP